MPGKTFPDMTGLTREGITLGDRTEASLREGTSLGAATRIIFLGLVLNGIPSPNR